MINTSQLELKDVTGRWHHLEAVAGHGASRPVSIRAGQGEWIGIVGSNGVGKSTLLHAIAGSAPYSAGEMSVLGIPMEPRDIDARFRLGVQHVEQKPSLPDAQWTMKDVEDIVFARRPALRMETPIRDLKASLEGCGCGPTFTPSEFVLAAAIASVPTVLLLDEIPGGSSVYRCVKQVLPDTAVVFIDHDVRQILDHANRIIWLSEDEAPKTFERTDAEAIRELTDALDRDPVAPGSEGDEEWWSIVDRDQKPIEQVYLSLTAGGSKAKLSRNRLLKEFEFLNSRKPASTLSGGQLTVLLWVLVELSGLARFPESLLRHLDTRNRPTLRAFRDSIDEKTK